MHHCHASCRGRLCFPHGRACCPLVAMTASCWIKQYADVSRALRCFLVAKRHYFPAGKRKADVRTQALLVGLDALQTFQLVRIRGFHLHCGRAGCLLDQMMCKVCRGERLSQSLARGVAACEQQLATCRSLARGAKDARGRPAASLLFRALEPWRLARTVLECRGPRGTSRSSSKRAQTLKRCDINGKKMLCEL